MKKLIIALVSLILITLLITGIVFICINIAHNNEKEQKINAMITEISNTAASFDEAEVTNDKIAIYNELYLEYQNYISDKNSNNYFEEVENEYEKNLVKIKESIINDYVSIIEANSINDFEKATDKDVKKSLENLVNFNSSINANVDSIEEINTYKTEIDTMISDMRKYFTSSYDDTISKNTIKNIEKITDKSKLEKTVKNLNELKDSFNINADITIGDEEVLNGYIKTIDELIESYENRIDEIKKAEEEAKKQEENQNSYDNNSYSNNSNGSSNSNSSNNSSNNNSSTNLSDEDYRWWSYTDEYGNTTYHDNRGNHWTEDGGYYNGDGNGWYSP